jgi:hypothetical protein
MSRRMFSLSLGFAMLFVSGLPSKSQVKFKIDGKNCGLAGSAKTVTTKAQNRQKNRFTSPASSDIDSAVTLPAMLAPGDDTDRFESSRAAEITGFVVKVTGTGAETCNCKSATTRFTDTHIDVVVDPGDASDDTKHVVVEVNPRLRAKMKSQGINWSSTQLHNTLLNRWVKFRGWLFFDQIHADEAENTTPGREKNWRATAWELHPVTSIEVLPGPPQ